MNLFTLAFWKSALEAVVFGAVTGFVAALPTNANVTLTELKAAGIGAATGALYAFVKQLGAVQSANAAARSGPRPIGAPQPPEALQAP
jgi:uncharacterized membrane-anchored protein